MVSEIGEEITKIAEAWVGVPFRDRGRTRAGVDCANFGGAVFYEAGVLLGIPKYNYRRGYWKRKPYLILEAVLSAIQCADPKYNIEHIKGRPTHLYPGDLLLVSQRPGIEAITHAVIVVEYSGLGVTIVHARQGGGSMPGQVEKCLMPAPWSIREVFRVG